MNRITQWLGEKWKTLSPGERKTIRLGAEVGGTVIARAIWKRLFVAGTAAAAVAVGSVVAAQQLSSSPKYPRIKTAWITHAGPYPVTHVQVPCYDVNVDQGVPPKGVGHTTEGDWAGAMSVFRQHYAPTFMVGRDTTGQVRIVQFCALGKIGGALVNLAGGVETNAWARAQIEMVAHSHPTAWQADPGVMAAFEALLYTLRDVAGIPLVHITNDSRNPTVWHDKSGWFDHRGVPENSHIDMQAFRWNVALNGATRFAPVVEPGAPEKPAKPTPAPKPKAARWFVCWTPYPRLPHCVRTTTPAHVVGNHAGASAITLHRLPRHG